MRALLSRALGNSGANHYAEKKRHTTADLLRETLAVGAADEGYLHEALEQLASDIHVFGMAVEHDPGRVAFDTQFAMLEQRVRVIAELYRRSMLVVQEELFGPEPPADNDAADAALGSP
jgi:hypothetical protein